MDFTYERTENFNGDTSKALEIARNTFLPNGFEIVQNDELSLEVKKELRISILHNHNLDPIDVISQASISCNDGKITLRAELGGIKKIISFYVKFIIGIFIVSIIVVGAAFFLNQDIPDAIRYLLPIGLVLIFVFTILSASTWFKAKAGMTLDTLMNNMLSISESYRPEENTKRKMTTPTVLFVSTIVIMIGFFVILAIGIQKTEKVSIYEELDSDVIEFILEQYKNTITETNGINTYASCQIYYVNNSFENFSGGMGYLKNNSGQTITNSTKLSSTSNLNQVLYDTSLRELKAEFKTDQVRKDFYHIFFTPDEPVKAGETFYYFWSNTKSQELAPGSSPKASLSMRNHPGSFVIETLFLVLPKSITPNPDNSPTSSKELENFNVYWWTKNVTPEEFHTENVLLTK